MAPRARRRDPQRRVWLLQWLRVQAARRHGPRRTGRGELVLGPGAYDEAQALLPLVAGEVRIGPEALELRAGRRPTGAEFEPAVGDEVDDGCGLRGAHRVVVRVGEEPDAVADAHGGGARRDRAVERIRRGAVRVLVEEVVLDGPERPEARGLAGHRLLDRVPVRDVVAVGTPRLGDGDLVEEGEVHRHHALRDLTTGRGRRDSNAL